MEKWKCYLLKNCLPAEIGKSPTSWCVYHFSWFQSCSSKLGAWKLLSRAICIFIISFAGHVNYEQALAYWSLSEFWVPPAVVALVGPDLMILQAFYDLWARCLPSLILSKLKKQPRPCLWGRDQRGVSAQWMQMAWLHATSRASLLAHRERLPVLAGSAQISKATIPQFVLMPVEIQKE